ncbi:unnamed protein product [Chrysodeixis includens]|uniref:Uncharacterized protein n=1 Tax=Chrysodeixis includens TaxID=689277 RepID=A0A9P0BX90_CHRIL|nr:unnamed protein product [Chrysodeixis includens]
MLFGHTCTYPTSFGFDSRGELDIIFYLLFNIYPEVSSYISYYKKNFNKINNIIFFVTRSFARMFLHYPLKKNNIYFFTIKFTLLSFNYQNTVLYCLRDLPIELVSC